MTRLPVVAAFAAALLAFAAPAGADDGAPILRGLSAAPRTFDPAKAVSAAERAILADLYEGLVVRDAAGKVVAGVAESWSVAADGLTWTFKLRKSEWSNGDPVTAADFIAAIKRVLDPAQKSPNAARLAMIKNAAKAAAGRPKGEELGLRAPDDATLEISLEQPTPWLLEVLAGTAALPVHREPPAQAASTGADADKVGAASDGGKAEAKPEAKAEPIAAVKGAGVAAAPPADAATLVVNGPYRLAAVTASRIELAANPRFRDAAAVATQRIGYEIVMDADTALRRFEAGELTTADTAPSYRLAPLKAKLGEALRIAPYLGIYYLALDTARPPLADRRIRRALALAIERDQLAAKWGNAMIPAASFVPPGIGAYGEPAEADFRGMPASDRLAAAKALLAEAIGPDKRLKLDLRIAKSDLNRETAAAIASDWKLIGVDANIIEADAAAHYRLLSGDRPYGAALAAWIGDEPDAANFLGLLKAKADDNLARFASQPYDALLAEAASTQDRDVRSALLYEAERLLLRDLPVVPLLHYASLSLVSPKLRGWTDNAVNLHPSRYLKLAE